MLPGTLLNIYFFLLVHFQQAQLTALDCCTHVWVDHSGPQCDLKMTDGVSEGSKVKQCKVQLRCLEQNLYVHPASTVCIALLQWCSVHEREYKWMTIHIKKEIIKQT